MIAIITRQLFEIVERADRDLVPKVRALLGSLDETITVHHVRSIDELDEVTAALLSSCVRRPTRSGPAAAADAAAGSGCVPIRLDHVHRAQRVRAHAERDPKLFANPEHS